MYVNENEIKEREPQQYDVPAYGTWQRGTALAQP